MKKIKLNKKCYIFISISLSFFLAIILFILYTKSVSQKINVFAKNYFEKESYNIINTEIAKLDTSSINNIIKIYYNKKDEISYVDYDLAKSYELLNKLTENIKANMGDIDVSLPFFVETNNVFLYNLGPSIKLKIKYADSIITKLYTKVTDYGLNNAMIELFVNISINGKALSMVDSNDIVVNYDLLISSKVINGKVPSMYGGIINKDVVAFSSAINA